jgi:hypothetical protein
MILPIKEIIEKAKRNINRNRNKVLYSYRGENCSLLLKSFVAILTEEYNVRYWNQIFEVIESLGFKRNPEIESIDNLENFLKEYSKSSVLDNE